MDPARRAYWMERQILELAAANDAQSPDPRRHTSALFAGQAANLCGAPVTGNPFPPNSRLFERWEAGWHVGKRAGDPLDERAAVAPAPAPRPLKLPKHAATHAAHTHPED